MKKEYLIIIPSIGLITIIALLLTNNLYFIDNLYQVIVIHNSYLTDILKFITQFGDVLIIVLICILLLIFYKNKKDLIPLYSITIISTIFNNILKLLFARPRPDLVHLVIEDTYSFPSGHASAAMTFYGYLIYMVWESKLEKKWKILLTIILSILILAIGYSRIYLNVHHISDILAGFMISIILLFTFINIKKANFAITRK